jgi:hypothetical protein
MKEYNQLERITEKLYLHKLKRFPRLVNKLDIYDKLKEFAFKVDEILDDYSNGIHLKYSSEEIYKLYNDISSYMYHSDPNIYDYSYYLIENFPKEIIRDTRINLILDGNPHQTRVLK